MIELLQRLTILPRWVIIFIDAGVILFSTFLTYFLRFNFDLENINGFNLWEGITLYTAIGVFSIIITKSYAGIVRYTGLEDGMRLLKAMAINVILACIMNLVFYYLMNKNFFPYSVLFISFFVSFLFLFFYRLLVKTVFSYYLNTSKSGTSTLIFGAGQSGLITKQVIDSDGSSKYNVIGFLEDDPKKVGKELSGTKIFNSVSLVELIKSKNVKELIISIKNLDPKRQSQVIETCLEHDVKVRRVPPVEDWVHGELSLKQIREVRIEDLLGRDVIKIESPEVYKTVSGKVVMVTGAAGSIGSELVNQLISFKPYEVILIDQAETPLHNLELSLRIKHPRIRFKIYLADVTNKDRVNTILREERPNIIFHAAAYKHVPMMEYNPSEAVYCNVCGTKNVADAAIENKVERFILISTDKAVKPTSVMGCSKRIAEIYVQSLNKKPDNKTLFITTRFGNVLGSNGSVIPRFKKQIEEGGPITVTHPDVTRYFMTIPEACNLVLEAGAMGNGGEVFVFDMGESIKIVDLAENMIRLSGLEVGKDIKIEFTGLREGEKLYEELLNDQENTIPTYHHKIMRAKLIETDYKETQEVISLLAHHSVNDEIDKMISLMKYIVPEFKTENKRFSEVVHKS